MELTIKNELASFSFCNSHTTIVKLIISNILISLGVKLGLVSIF